MGLVDCATNPCQDDGLKCNASSTLGRRAFLKLSGLAALGNGIGTRMRFGSVASPEACEAAGTEPTHVLHIRRMELELAPGQRFVTLTYNGQLPGPLIRGTVGLPVRIDVYNETDSLERIHCQDQLLRASSEDTIPGQIPPHSRVRIEFIPRRPGLFLYHSQQTAAADLTAGLYSGQVGVLLIEPAGTHDNRLRFAGRTGRAGRAAEPASNARFRLACTREQVLILKDCEPFIRRTQRGCEIGYRTLTLNGRPLAEHPPLNIDRDRRVLLHILNASATESHALGLPGNTFDVVERNGTPTLTAAPTPTLALHPGERVSAIVEIHHPASWIASAHPGILDPLPTPFEPLAAVHGSAPAGRHAPLAQPTAVRAPAPVGHAPAAMIDLTLTRHEAARSGFNRWCINGRSFSAAAPHTLFRMQPGFRYRLSINNTSDEILPLHLQRHRLQIVSRAGRPIATAPTDIIAAGPRERLEVDFEADGHGPALLHCTRQLQRDFGLIALLKET